jgi:hypothetical protein
MNVNSHADSLIKLHRDYVVCLKGSIDQFLKAEVPGRKGEVLRLHGHPPPDRIHKHHEPGAKQLLNHSLYAQCFKHSSQSAISLVNYLTTH